MNLDFLYDKKKVGSLFFFLSSLLFLMLLAYSFLKPLVGFDDFFSLGVIRYPFWDMINILSTDVHPPLYYIILKCFVKLLSPANNVALVYVAKFVAVLPVALLLVFVFTKVKKELGVLTAGLFAFLIMSSSNVLYHGSAIRMYDWALLFVTVQLVYAYCIINKPSKSSWVFFTLASICAIYTHYFAAISSIVIYLLLLAYLVYIYIIDSSSQIRLWLVSAIVTFISYLPWLPALINQLSTVTEGYWISDITINTLFGYLDFIFKPLQGDIGLILEVLIIVVFIALIYLAYKNRKPDDYLFKFSLVSIAVLVLTVLLGVVFSILVQPVIISRYLIPSFGCLWLGFSILLSKIFDNKKLFYIITIFLLIFSIASAVNFTEATDMEYATTEDCLNFFNSINDGNIVIFDSYHSYLRYAGFLDNDLCVFNLNHDVLNHYPDQNIILFNRHTFDNLDEDNFDVDNFNLEKIHIIHQDVVYLVKV